ncbi:uncharacterized protein LOC124141030 isoform X1 [Haliotis rufescens]|uniref:uncharacterized protein LOC124141030 isoform X1 n=1 Tax=Haliotis rufescens TaxID=6454 RepID=UPI00201F5DD8|nr:uncharacterized protein LOC124141030 isoform X1 [Haliotis rufescens]
MALYVKNKAKGKRQLRCRPQNDSQQPVTVPQKVTLVKRARKRLSTYLHTHVCLILVCSLAALDAACVIGQIICDILIMKEDLHHWQVLDADLTVVLVKQVPLLNGTNPEHLNLEKIYEKLSNYGNEGGHDVHTAPLTHFMDTSAPSGPLTNGARGLPIVSTTTVPGHTTTTASGTAPQQNASGEPLKVNLANPFMKSGVIHKRAKRAAEGSEEDDGHGHSLLHELTHAFHLGSMAILSMLLLETLLKSFAMGRKILHHKLECFDVFVVTVSWCLDVAFYEGIWAHPGTEAATILIFILPWRVVRIVNSFVLVIQEKDHVQLKIVKQRLRLSVKKSKDLNDKSSSYKIELKQLQGLCRKHGATESEINLCGPGGKRRRSSLYPGLESFAAIALSSALGNHPSLALEDSDDDNSLDSSRQSGRTPVIHTVSNGSIGSIGSDLSFNMNPSAGTEPCGLDNPVFDNDDPMPPTYDEVALNTKL